MSVAPVVLHCPVCRARFRGTRECSRCGADLEPLMILAVRGHHAREAARRALERGEVVRAHELATAAQSLHATPEGRRLCRLTAWWFGLDDGPAAQGFRMVYHSRSVGAGLRARP
ncbi:MAG: hypothetical protein GY856_48690 [bacterium]|nr:hypothetical protein [bacterium]